MSRGVTQLKSGRWRAQVWDKAAHTVKCIGTYSTEAEASAAYQQCIGTIQPSPPPGDTVPLSAKSLAILHEYQTEKGIETLEKALAQVIAGWQRLYWRQRKTKAWAAYWAKIQPPKG